MWYIREGEENEKECQKGEERGEVRANEEWGGRREGSEEPGR